MAELRKRSVVPDDLGVEATRWSTQALCSAPGQSLLSCLGAALEPGDRPHARHPIVKAVLNRLAREPSLSCTELAEELKLSSSWLARTFKREMKRSIVEYRNDLRIAAFLEKLNQSGGNLREAARAAGFGSYAQFHRVFRARYGRSASAYLRAGEGEPKSDPEASRIQTTPPPDSGLELEVFETPREFGAA